MRVGSLFSGVGGFDLGLECAGMDVVWQVENDRWCRQVLRARWSDVDLYGDVKDVGCGCADHPELREASGQQRYVEGATESRNREPDVTEPCGGCGRTSLAPVDLICGGFPCQDLSVAGRRAGLAGERSGLFFEFVRIAREVAPRWLLVENVPGLLSSHDGRDFAVLLRELTGFWPVVPDAGWQEAGVCEGPQGRAVWRVLDTQHFGPPQRRRRVFVVVDTTGRCGPEILLEPSCVPGHPAAGREAGEGAAGESAEGVGAASGVANCINARDAKGPLPSRQIENVVGAGNSYDNTPWTWGFSSNRSLEDLRGDTSPTVRIGSGVGIPSPPAVFNLRGRDGGAMPEPDDKASVRSAQGGSSRSYVYPTLRENWRNNSNPATEARMLVSAESGFSEYRDGRPHLRRKGGDAGGGSEAIVGSVPRRLTPTETERLQGFPELTETVVFNLWDSSDQQMNRALVETRSPSGQRYAWSADDGGWRLIARSAENGSNTSPRGPAKPVAASVLIDSERDEVAVHRARRLIWSAKTAESESGSPLSMPTGDFAHLAVGTIGCLARTVRTGRGAPQANSGPSSRHGSGGLSVNLSGPEIRELASDAETLGAKAKEALRFITSPRIGATPISAPIWKTCFSCVTAAITGFIPTETLTGDSFAIAVTKRDGWTATGIDADGEPTEISDTQRYRQMGNAVSVPVAAWVGSRIVAAEMGAVEETA